MPKLRGSGDSPSQGLRCSRALPCRCAVGCFGKLRLWSSFHALGGCGAPSSRGSSLSFGCMDKRDGRGWSSRGDLAEYLTAESRGGLDSSVGHFSSGWRGRGSCGRAGSPSGQAGRARAAGCCARAKSQAAPRRSELPGRGARELFPPDPGPSRSELTEADWKKLDSLQRALLGTNARAGLLASTTPSSPRLRPGLWILGRGPTRSTGSWLFRLGCWRG